MSSEEKFKDNYNSRSELVYGKEILEKVSKMKILIIGMRGLGVETAKNIILNNPLEIDIFDPKKVTINDLGSNFFLSEEDVGKKNRDEACLEKLNNLNTYVTVNIFKIEENNNMEEYTKLFCEKIHKYNVVVFTELYPMDFIDKIDKECRKNSIKLIYGICLGLAGYVFTDFGPKHIIYDENGQEMDPYLVKSITKDKEGLVTIDTIQRTVNLTLGDGDFVRFKGVEGMTELNEEGKEFQITFEDYKSFKIGDTSNFGEYTKGGTVYQIKKPKIMEYSDFSKRSKEICDYDHPIRSPDSTKNGRAELLYLTLLGIHDFYLKHNNSLPELNKMEQAKEIVENVKIMYNTEKEKKTPCYENIQEFDEKVVLNITRWASANIIPVCAFFGGIIAQEIIKITGKYIPIDQWLIFDFLEVVENLGDNIDRTLQNCRYNI